MICCSHIHERSNLLLELIVERLGEYFEGLVDIATLHGAHFTKFKTDVHGKGVTILCGHLQLAIEVHLFSDNDAC